MLKTFTTAGAGRIALLAGAGIAALAFTAPAHAQDAPGETQADRPLENEGESATEEESGIVVTGSRIRRPDFDTAEPTQVVTSQFINERALTNVADALNEGPAIRGSVTPNGAQGSFGQGVNFVNTYGLGSNRTLTLINGRRSVSSNVATLFNQGSFGTQVDLNVVPTALVDRIEIVSIGGAPVYGSDAISGVVNVITKTKYEGINLQGTAGINERGDGFRWNAAAVVGGNFLDDRLNVTLSYTHDEQKGFLQNSRSFYRDGLGNATNPTAAQAAALFGRTGVTAANDGRVNPNIPFDGTATDDIPGLILVRDLTIPFLTTGGLIISAPGSTGVANAFAFDGNGNLLAYDRGIGFPGINASQSSASTFRFQTFGQITSDLRRDIGNAFLTYEISPEAVLFFEGTYFKSRGDELVQQPTFNTNLFGGASGPLQFNINSPFLTPQARAELQSRGVNNFTVSRASLDLADLTGFSETDLWRGVAGIRGDVVAFGDRNFYYEIYANIGRNIINDFRQDINRQNFINAVNVTTVNGQIVCTTAPTVGVGFAAPGGTPVADPNCRPLNLLGEGRASAEARAYVISDNRTRNRIEQEVYAFNVGGSPFDIFGNNVGVSLGYEHRREFASFEPSQFEQQGLGRAVAIGALSGGYNIDEALGEINIPLITSANDISFLNRVEVYGRGRVVNNSVNGNFFSWAAGGLLSPVPDITFRGNFTRSFRTPAVVELFLPVSNTFTTVPDLCSTANRNAGPSPATRLANCTAFLTAFPGATPLLAANATVPGRSGGNPNLQNEQADSYTFGVVLKPRFIDNFLLSADYVSIDIFDPIANLSVAQIASACFDNPDFNTSDPANGNAFCSRIRRDANGQVPADPANPAVTSGFVNGNRIKFRGIQGGFDWILNADFISPSSRFELAGTALYVAERLNDITGVAPVRTDGTVGDPKFAGQVIGRYWNDDWGATVITNITGRQLIARTTAVREIQSYDPYATVNASVYFDIAERFRMTLSVTNLFDRIGQEYFGFLIPGSINDAFGRRYAVSVNAKF